MADEELDLAAEAGKVLVTGGVVGSIFGVVGGFIGFQWYESAIGPSCTHADVVLGNCAAPTLPVWGPVESPMGAATVFGLLAAVVVGVVCLAIYFGKKRRA
jgi:hypothetical protein